MTPLHKACQYGALRAVEELVKEGADVLFQNDVSPSPPAHTSSSFRLPCSDLCSVILPGLGGARICSCDVR